MLLLQGTSWVPFRVLMSALAIAPAPGELSSPSGLHDYPYTCGLQTRTLTSILKGLGIQLSDRECASMHRALGSIPSAMIGR